jgi:hypothetical protein
MFRAHDHPSSPGQVAGRTVLLEKLTALPAGARRDLLRVLVAHFDVRADLIRQFYERDDTRSLADVLMDLESDDVLRVTVIGLLEELEEP